MNIGNEMTTAQFLIFVAPFLATILIVFGMKYIAAIFQARARTKGDEMYRALAEKSLKAQTESETALAAIRNDLSKLASSLAEVEKMLRQVG